MTYYTKQPLECTDVELKKFYELVVKGRKVRGDGLEDRILNCEFLAFCIDDNIIVAVSAIKKPTKNYREGIVAKSKINRQWSELTYEVGYSFTEVEYRRKGISSELKRRLLTEMTTRKGIIFSTTAITSSQKFFAENGFKNVGEPYDGENDKSIKYYEKILLGVA